MAAVGQRCRTAATAASLEVGNDQKSPLEKIRQGFGYQRVIVDLSRAGRSRPTLALYGIIMPVKAEYALERGVALTLFGCNLPTSVEPQCSIPRFSSLLHYAVYKDQITAVDPINFQSLW